LHGYVGAETDHTVIPFGKGICGQAVSNENFVVPDVAAQDNYIALYSEVRNWFLFCKWKKHWANRY
jgi:GAF domain-containing protein